MKKTLYILFIACLFCSCSEYQKALKSEDTALKFKMGTELYEAGKWNKAHGLFEQIAPKYAGKPQAEKLTFINAMCSYNMGDFYVAGYKFNRFVGSYPKSEKREEAAFLSAKSAYELSPVYSKNQKETVDALDNLQLFVNTYPDSEYLEESNKLIKELDFKLEKKAFEIASQYNRIFDYKASVKSFNNFLLDFPGATLREDAMFGRFNAAYNLATFSVDYLKEDRINTAMSYFETLKKAYPNSEYLEEATKLNADLLQQKNTLITKS